VGSAQPVGGTQAGARVDAEPIGEPRLEARDPDPVAHRAVGRGHPADVVGRARRVEPEHLRTGPDPGGSVAGVGEEGADCLGVEGAGELEAGNEHAGIVLGRGRSRHLGPGVLAQTPAAK